MFHRYINRYCQMDQLGWSCSLCGAYTEFTDEQRPRWVIPQSLHALNAHQLGAQSRIHHTRTCNQRCMWRQVPEGQLAAAAGAAVGAARGGVRPVRELL